PQLVAALPARPRRFAAAQRPNASQAPTPPFPARARTAMDRPEPNAELRQTFEPLRTAFAVLALLLGMLACARADSVPVAPRAAGVAAAVAAPPAEDADTVLDTGAGLFALLLALGLGRTRQRH
ncbi:MAG TPA: hypothetical protein PLN91_07930, partial [Rhodanobacteraceae bacterium]|nr:hypothetical protein [Rhodanobacteraceae bacterium]